MASIHVHLLEVPAFHELADGCVGFKWLAHLRFTV